MSRVLAARYQLVSQLGTGGTGTVWQATDLRLEVSVAVKLLDPTIAEDEKSLTRFLREAKTIAKLKSRHIVQSFDCGVDGGQPFIVMELLEGETLRERLKARGYLAPLETVGILSDVSRAMHVAHTNGIVHRDLKPENVFLALQEEGEVVKVLDFGIAKRKVGGLDTASVVLTEPGSIFGTPYYMSPEQIDAHCPVDLRSDIWAIGIMAYECLTGRLPFGENTVREQFLAICGRPMPIPSSVANVPDGFDDWFARAAAQDLDRRFASMREASAELRRICGVEPYSLAAPSFSGQLSTSGRPSTLPCPAPHSSTVVAQTAAPMPIAPEAQPNPPDLGVDAQKAVTMSKPPEAQPSMPHVGAGTAPANAPATAVNPSSAPIAVVPLGGRTWLWLSLVGLLLLAVGFGFRSLRHPVDETTDAPSSQIDAGTFETAAASISAAMPVDTMPSSALPSSVSASDSDPSTVPTSSAAPTSVPPTEPQGGASATFTTGAAGTGKTAPPHRPAGKVERSDLVSRAVRGSRGQPTPY
jgi:eukaryotic-like serine/threonine-protein kinase